MVGRRSVGQYLGTCLLIFSLTQLYVEPRITSSKSGGHEGLPAKNGILKTYSYIGCYEDKSEDRDLNSTWIYHNDNVTEQLCYDHCHNGSYQYFGLQNGENCVCSNSYGRHGPQNESECKEKCAGNSTQICGGRHKNSVFIIEPLNCTIYQEDMVSTTNCSSNNDTAGADDVSAMDIIACGKKHYSKEDAAKQRRENSFNCMWLVIEKDYNCTTLGNDTAQMMNITCSKDEDKRSMSNCGIQTNIGPPCSRLVFEACGNQMESVRNYVEQNKCDCGDIPDDYIWAAPIRCKLNTKLKKEDLGRVFGLARGNTLSTGGSDQKTVPKKDIGKGRGQGRGRGLSEGKFNALLTRVINEYHGPVQDMLELKSYAQILPRDRMSHLTIADVDRNSSMLFVTLPAPKKLALTRQTLEQFPYHQKTIEIGDLFASKGCGFVSSISVDTLSVPGFIGLDLAVNMCACSEQDEVSIPTKMRILCEIIETSTRRFEDFIKLANNLCPICFVYMLRQRPDWQAKVLANRTMRDSACDKVGNSFILSPPVLTQWANVCTEPSIPHVSGCKGLRPSLMAYQPSPPSPADLATCKDVFCTRLCTLTQDDVYLIRRTLHNSQHEDLGCLAYLDGVSLQQGTIRSMVNGSSIPGSCRLRSRLMKRVRTEGHQRQKRSCSVTCGDIEGDISLGINPPDVIDVVQIETCLDPQEFSNCMVKNPLGDYQWDVEQAKALFNVLRQRRSLNTSMFLHGNDLDILGFIGLGFTPDELNTIDGITDEVYEAFGAAYGWSPEQLKALAQRYLRENKLEPYQLDNIHLARLNHLVCGLSREQIQGITLKAIHNSTSILGAMKRCETEVLEVIARRLVIYQGPVKFWHEDDFSEYGIILAGLSGDELRAVEDRLSDHVTVAIVNHIPPQEFRKLTPEQTSMFNYDVSLALSRRGLCAWLTDQHKQGNLEHHCSGVSSVLLSSLVLMSAVVVSTVANCLLRL